MLTLNQRLMALKMPKEALSNGTMNMIPMSEADKVKRIETFAAEYHKKNNYVAAIVAEYQKIAENGKLSEEQFQRLVHTTQLAAKEHGKDITALIDHNALLNLVKAHEGAFPDFVAAHEQAVAALKIEHALTAGSIVDTLLLKETSEAAKSAGLTREILMDAFAASSHDGLIGGITNLRKMLEEKKIPLDGVILNRFKKLAAWELQQLPHGSTPGLPGVVTEINPRYLPSLDLLEEAGFDRTAMVNLSQSITATDIKGEFHNADGSIITEYYPELEAQAAKEVKALAQVATTTTAAPAATAASSAPSADALAAKATAEKKAQAFLDQFLTADQVKAIDDKTGNFTKLLPGINSRLESPQNGMARALQYLKISAKKASYTLLPETLNKLTLTAIWYISQEKPLLWKENIDILNKAGITNFEDPIKLANGQEISPLMELIKTKNITSFEELTQQMPELLTEANSKGLLGVVEKIAEAAAPAADAAEAATAATTTSAEKKAEAILNELLPSETRAALLAKEPQLMASFAKNSQHQWTDAISDLCKKAHDHQIDLPAEAKTKIELFLAWDMGRLPKNADKSVASSRAELFAEFKKTGIEHGLDPKAVGITDFFDIIEKESIAKGDAEEFLKKLPAMLPEATKMKTMGRDAYTAAQAAAAKPPADAAKPATPPADAAAASTTTPAAATTDAAKNAANDREWYQFFTHSAEEGKAVEFSLPRTAISGAVALGLIGGGIYAYKKYNENSEAANDASYSDKVGKKSERFSDRNTGSEVSANERR